MLYPTLGKIFKNKKEFNDTIEQIKSSVQLMKYFDKAIHITFEQEIIYINGYRITGITDIEGNRFKIFIKLFKEYKQYRVYSQFEDEVFSIDALKNINLNLI